jgi:MFS family permease
MLDGMDVMVYSFVLPTLITVWRLSATQAGFLATATLIVSSLGGWVAGVLADRYGRVRILQLTILWFAVFTFLSGFTANYGQLLITRALQGLGFGGEWAVGAILMGEAIRPELRGRVVGAVQSGWAVGWGIAAVAYAVLFSALPANVAWRALFWLGLAPALLVFYIRRHVPEPVVSRASDETRRVAPLAIFRTPLFRVTVCASLLSTGAQGGYYAIHTWLPLYLKSVRSLSVLSSFRYVAVVIFGSFLGYLAGAYLTDRLGRRGTLLIFAAASFATVWLYTRVTISTSAALPLGFPLGFFSSGSFSPMGAFLTELFPAGSRGSGQGFTYNVGRAAGALFPALVGALTAQLSLASAIAVFAMGAYTLMACGVLVLPETRGRTLG